MTYSSLKILYVTPLTQLGSKHKTTIFITCTPLKILYVTILASDFIKVLNTLVIAKSVTTNQAS